MKNTLIITIFFLLVIVFQPAHSEIALKSFNTAKNNPTYRLYIGGVGVGLSWANIRMATKGIPPLYCQPESLALNSDNYISFIEQAVAKEPDLHQDMPIELILLDALVDAFPCD